MRALTEQAVIKATTGAVWTVLADFGRVDRWAPNMKSCQLIGEKETGIGTRRRMRHAWGFQFEEVVTGWAEGAGISFNVLRAPFPMIRVNESWAIRQNGCGTRVVTRVEYDMNLGLLGRLLDWQLVRFIVRREMKAGLRGLSRLLEEQSAD